MLVEDIAMLAALADGKSMRTAARALALSKSALSRRIAAFEARLGQELFLRRGRALAPTSFGEAVTARALAAQVALAALDEAAAQAGHAPRLTLAVSPPFAEILLPKVLPRVAHQYRSVRVEIRLSHAYSDLFDGRVDVAVRRGPLADSTSINARRLGSLQMVCVAAPALARAVGQSAEDYAKASPWVRASAPLEPFSLALTIGKRKRAVTVAPRFAVDDQRTALSLAALGLGVVRVNSALARAALDRGEVVEVLPEARSSEGAFVVYARHRRLDAARRDLVAAIIDVSRGLAIWE